MQLERKKFILWVWSLMPEQSVGNNHTRWIRCVSLKLIKENDCFKELFLLAGQKVHFFAPCGPKISIFDPQWKKIVCNTGEPFIFNSTSLENPIFGTCRAGWNFKSSVKNRSFDLLYRYQKSDFQRRRYEK